MENQKAPLNAAEVRVPVREPYAGNRRRGADVVLVELIACVFHADHRADQRSRLVDGSRRDFN